jgi:tyrosine-protein kinase Etk/Wzc
MNWSKTFAFLLHRRSQMRIGRAALACAAIAALYVVIAPRWYRAVLTVVPAKPQKAGLSSMLGGELGGLAASLDPSLGGGADAPRTAAVLQSIAVSDAVIEKFDLRARYREKYQESAREALWRHCEVKTLPKPNLIQLSCEDKDPRFAQAMLQFFAEYGNQVFRRVGVSSASEEVRFLEGRTAELHRQADETATRMREFQEKYRIVDLDTQAKAVVSAVAALNTQRIAKQLELEYARTFSAGDEATLQSLRSQLSVVGDKLRDLEDPPAPVDGRRRSGDREGATMFPAALSVPKLRAEYEGLYRDRKVAEATLVFALERLEAARATEARDVSTFMVLDPPTLPTRHARPKRLVVLLAATLLGAFLVTASEWWRNLPGQATIRPADRDDVRRVSGAA